MSDYAQNTSAAKDAVKAIHLFATVGSPTARGGWVSDASSDMKISGLAVPCVGDTVTYSDGSKAVIIDGAGFGASYLDKPFALVGSRLDNGDHITATLQACGHGVTEYQGKPIEGLFDPSYVHPFKVLDV
ncbi:PAAR domain-containing protein [Dyella caseinilytica]|uniref:PAAR domain-containing protein n=1 Tax=Dyella caseinilytica TaxID=1849581 RepID=A0ABX7GXU9_9GAMM|nr:PAAR domain-containing protein [Dyella caseinilytica]QRN54669.1 PAAR domain-containing protein [Dyella caseinilytica]GFZ95935.1 hypothetical protein GCM10011408_15300 [Dyella caseinilytica]